MALLPNFADHTIDDEITLIRRMNYDLYQAIKNIHELIFNLVWKNKNKFTPEQIMEKIGTDAVAMFEVSSAIQSLLLQVNPSYVPLLPTKNVTMNEDGTVTLSDKE
jgi:hypothetical protein